MMIIKIAIFFLSFWGYVFHMIKRYSIPVEFSPAILCASGSSIMFLAGLLNIMPVITAFLWIIGLFLFIYHVRKIQHFERRFIIIGIAWCCILIYFMFLLKDSFLIHYDDFSHWGLVAQNILLNDKMPNFSDPIITFQAYPLGSALWIYYVCKGIGISEGCFLFAQAVMLVSFLFPLVVWIKRTNLYLILLPILFGVFSLSYNISISALLVDTVMPLAGIAAFCIVGYEKEDMTKSIWECLPLYIFLVQVKNSGIFFLAVCLVYWIGIHWKKLYENKKFIYMFSSINIIVPFLTMFLWKQHVALVFTNAQKSKHAMDFVNYREVFKNKTSETIYHIAKNVLTAVFELPWNGGICMGTMLLISTVLGIIILQYIVAKKNIKFLLYHMIAYWGIFIIYAFFVFAMYLFSMPVNEAVVLAGFDRYMRTVLIFIYGIALYVVLREWNPKTMIQTVIPFIMLSAVMMLSIKKYGNSLSMLYSKQKIETQMRGKLNSIIQKNNIEKGKRYLIYTTYNDSGYLYYMSRYVLQSTDVSVIQAEKIEDININDKDYLIIMDSDEILEIFLKEEGLGEYIGSKQVGIHLQ